jgi:hypothetical protein
MTDSAWQPLTAHSPETGGPIVSHPTAGGQFYIVNGRAVCRAAPAGKGVMYYSGTPASADYSVQADLRIFDATGAAGIVGRCSTSASTFYYAYVTNNNGELVLAKMVGGAITSLDTFNSPGFFAAGSTYSIRLTMAGTSIKAFVDGVERCSVTDSGITAVGRGGIRGINLSDTGTGKHLDNFLVYDAATPPTAAGRSHAMIIGL